MSKEEIKRTELSELGEFGLIRELSKSVKLSRKSSVKGIGDDAAILKWNSKKNVVITTDMLTEGVHFNLAYCPLKHLGYKAVAVNVSDIYAMGAIPTHITVSVALSNRFSLEAIKELYEGINLACANYGVDLIGGDTTSSSSGLVMSITALGETDATPIYRSGAKEYDLLCVSGDLGAAYVGLQILERENAVFLAGKGAQPDLGKYPYVLERQLKPEPRKDIVEYFKKEGIVPSAMIDISDGLASEIMHICEQSNVGCTIYEEKLPIDQETFNVANELNLSPTICALNGGEDYELLFTISQKEYDKIKDYQGVTIIGHITDQNSGANMVTGSDTIIPLTAQGWDAFNNKTE